MGWLNTPESIIENDRVIKETIGTWYTNDEGILTHESRWRLITWITTRYVGCDYTGAKTKENELAALEYEDVHLDVQTGGQYHCVATQKTEGEWSEWADDS